MELQENKKKGQAIKHVLIVVGITLLMLTTVAFADPVQGILADVINVIIRIATAIGVVLIAFGIFQIIIALKNEDADAKIRATQSLVVAAILVGIGPIVNGFNLLSYLP